VFLFASRKFRTRLTFSCVITSFVVGTVEGTAREPLASDLVSMTLGFRASG
jgi:hypothetical protein